MSGSPTPRSRMSRQEYDAWKIESKARKSAADDNNDEYELCGCFHGEWCDHCDGDPVTCVGRDCDTYVDNPEDNHCTTCVRDMFNGFDLPTGTTEDKAMSRRIRRKVQCTFRGIMFVARGYMESGIRYGDIVNVTLIHDTNITGHIKSGNHIRIYGNFSSSYPWLHLPSTRKNLALAVHWAVFEDYVHYGAGVLLLS